MSVIRIGMIGIGPSVRMHHLPCLHRLDGQTRIVATCDAHPEHKLPEITAYTDVREMLAQENLDAVYVLTPPGTHLEPVCLALDRGCHVFCEMPPALEPLEAMQMVAFARASRRTLMFGGNRLYAPTYQRMKKITALEPPRMTVLTKCRHALTEFSAEFAGNIDAHCAEYYEEDGTPMFNFITQFLEVAEWMNGPIVDCEATPTPLRPGGYTNTRTVAYLRHQNSARSMLSYDEFGAQVYEHITLHASGSTYIVRGSLVQPNELLIWSSRGEEVFPGPKDPMERGGFLGQTAAFLDSIREQRLCYPDADKLARIISLARRIDGSAWWQGGVTRYRRQQESGEVAISA